MRDHKRPREISPWLQKLLPIFVFIFCLSTVAVCRSIAQDDKHPQITIGFGNFQFTDEKGDANKPIRVWYFRPQTLTAQSPVVFVMHGVARDAERYCKDWIPYAQKENFLLVCPEFSAEMFPTRAYQRGNMFDESNRAIPQSKWTFTTIENLFDYVRTLTANASTSYYIYGHSAGGQFVHRFVLFMPNARYKRAVAANSGWYTMPTYSRHSFPYSLRGTGATEKSLRSSFARDFVLLLGTDDLEAQDPELRQTGAAEEQGRTRFERGQNYYRAAQTEAAQLGAQLNWQLQTVPGAHHSDAQMARAAAAILFAK